MADTVNNLVTAEDLLRLPDDGHRHELVAGKLTTLPYYGGRRSSAAARIGAVLATFIHDHHLGFSFAANCGFHIATGPDTVRTSDFAFVSNARMTRKQITNGFILQAPDLAIEFLSPDDRAVEIDDK